ncbi:MAG: hypothetical protein PHR35_14175 [Kiritimatiellae bacterium]|nr:hypothetical protein [Kiritimatiellia bacterium]
MAPLLALAEPGPIVDLDFNAVSEGVVRDRSAFHQDGRLIGKAALAEGADGYALRVPGYPSCVNINLADRFRNLEALTVSCWLSPEEVANQEVITAANNPTQYDGLPFMLRWWANWSFIFETTTADGERRGVIVDKPGIDRISYPKYHWTHVAATYDGVKTVFYVNGEPVASKEWPKGKKGLMKINHPLKIGGHNTFFKGGVDNLKLFDRALNGYEVKAEFTSKKGFVPKAPGKEFPGTIDGFRYVSCGRAGENWFVMPLKQGALQLTSAGECKVWAKSDKNPSSQWDTTSPISVSDQAGKNERFYREVSGNVELRADGTSRLELRGKTTSGLGVNQVIEVTTNDEARFHYELSAETAKAAPPVLFWTQHLWPSAMRFVGTDERGLITGNLMDLDGDLRFKDLLEINLISGDSRLVAKFGPDTRFHVRGTRNPKMWLDGWANFQGMLESAKATDWSSTKTVAFDFTIMLEPDDRPPRLDRAQARTVTRDVPFDFNRLYDADVTRLALIPFGRDLPVFMDDESVVFKVEVPKGQLMETDRYEWTLTDADTKELVRRGELKHSNPFWEWGGKVVFPAPKAGAYELNIRSLDVDGNTLDECRTEVVVAGEIAQPSIKAGEPLELKKVDEVDLTADKPGHDFYSYSGLSKVVKGDSGSWRETLTFNETQAFLSGAGALKHAWWGCDWYGVRFKTKAGKLYVVEMEYPDREFMSVSAYLMEPKDDPRDGKARPVQRTSTGLFTGTFVPFDGKMKTFQTVHFASAPWVAVCLQNAHVGRPNGDLTPASVRKITLYEVIGDLPKLDAPADGNRLLGVYCESGGLAVCPFGPNSFRGELGNWHDSPKPEVYYREAYKTVANLVKYMRYRGDTTLFYGIYRYRSAQFPSRTFPPSVTETDFDMAGLIARMFEKNGLKLVLNVMANNPLPTSRLHEYSRNDIHRGASGVAPVNNEGIQPQSHRDRPAVNPFHPRVREAFATLAAELGERYGKYPAVAGISWMTGQAWWEPCLPTVVPGNGTEEENERDLLRAQVDDETMRQFAEWAKVTLPGKPDDPQRFQQRFDWIWMNAREQFKDFRCWGMAQTHLTFQKAFAEKAPGKDYLALDYYQDIFVRKAGWAPLEACRLFGGGPKFYRDVPGLVYYPYVPEINGAVHWEHSTMSWEQMPRMQAFVQDEALSKEWDAADKSARFIHRQFYEQIMFLRDEPDRKWIWAPDLERLATCSYPQQGGPAYRLDFLLALARGTPNYISYMWCDSTLPMGHEREHQQFAAAYRALPQGRYREADRRDQVFVRYDDTGKKVFYVVNAAAAQADVEVKTGLAGTFADVVSGAELKATDGKAKLTLPPYSLHVYRMK